MDSRTSSYSKFCALKNGTKLQIRELNNGDHEELIKFLQLTPEELLQFCKANLQNPDVVNSWKDPGNGCPGISLVALDLETRKVVGSIFLAKGQHSARKVGEVQQIVVAKPLHGLGLGSLLLDSLIYLASKEDLHWLKAEVVTEMKKVTRAFESRGFKTKTILEEYFSDNQGKMYDVSLMMRPLIEQEVDF